MVSPAAISAGTYGSSGATTVAEATTSAVTTGNKVIAFVFWFGAASLSSVSGGGLTWTVHVTSTGTAHRVAIASADAPSGLASGTTITANFSTFADARGIRLVQCDGLVTNAGGAVDGTGSNPSASTTTNWSVSLTTTTANDVVFGCDWADFYTAGMTATSPATEIYDWTTSDGSESHAVWKVATASGANTIAGSFTGARTNAAAAVAFKPFVPSPNVAIDTIATVPASAKPVTAFGGTTPRASNRWWNALRSGRARYVVVGDSYVQGVAATTKANTFASKIATVTRTARSISGSSPGLMNFEDAASHTGTVISDDSQTQSAGAHCTGSASVTWNITGTAFDVMYRQTPGAAAITVKVDGTTVGTITHPGSGSNDPSHIQSFSGLSSGAHTVQLVTTDGQYIDGIIPYNGDGPTAGITFIQCGRSGTTTDYWVSTNPAARNGWDQFGPDLVVVEPVINDCWNNVALATTKANVANQITFAQSLPTSPTVLYVVPFFTNYATFFDDGTASKNSLGLNLDDYRTAVIDAATQAGAFVIDMRRYIPDPVGSGYLDAGHPNDAGHLAYANAINTFLQANDLSSTVNLDPPTIGVTGQTVGVTSAHPSVDLTPAVVPATGQTVGVTSARPNVDLTPAVVPVAGQTVGVTSASPIVPLTPAGIPVTGRTVGVGGGSAPTVTVTFTPPTVRQTVKGDRLFSRYGTQVGQSVVKRDGVYTLTPIPWNGEIFHLQEGVDYFLGGREYTVTAEIAAALDRDGFGYDYTGYGEGGFGYGPYGG